jgi:integrase
MTSPQKQTELGLKYLDQLPSGRWRLLIRSNSIGRIAETHDTLEAAQAARDKHLGNVKGELKKSSTLRETWERYALSQKFANYKANTRRTRTSRIVPVLKKLGEIAIGNITPNTVENYAAARKAERKKKPGEPDDQLRLELDALSATLAYAKKMQVLETNPTLGVSRPRGGTRARRWTPAEEGLLMRLSAGKVKALRKAARFMLLVRALVCRPGELQHARYADLDLEQQTITLRDTKYRGETRTVPFSSVTKSLFSAVLEDELAEFPDSPYIFSSHSRKGGEHQGAPVPYHYGTAIQNARTKYRALPKGLTAHIGRHEGSSDLVEDSPLTMPQIMRLTGHHSAQAFEIYNHAEPVKFAPQIEAHEAHRQEDRIAAAAALAGIPLHVMRGLLIANRKPTDSELATIKDKEPSSELASRLIALANPRPAVPVKKKKRRAGNKKR